MIFNLSLMSPVKNWIMNWMIKGIADNDPALVIGCFKTHTRYMTKNEMLNWADKMKQNALINKDQTEVLKKIL